MIDCGRLAKRIAWVMFWKRIVTREILFTLPKPLVHLIYLINITPKRTIRRRGDRYQERGDKLTKI